MAPEILLFAHTFLIVASAVAGKAARDAIFLGRFTPLQMTAVDLATMVAVVVVIGAQSRARARLPLRRVLVLAPLCFAAGDAALWAVTTRGGPLWMPWAVYVWVGVQASILAPHASVLAGQMLDLRQARQTCGLVGAGAIAGWIGGGLIARIIALQMGAPALLLACGLLASLCPAVVAASPRVREDPPPPSVDHRRAGGRGISASTVWRSPHLRAMAVLAFISAVVGTIAGFQFKAIARQSIVDSGEMAALFGTVSVYAGLVALAAQLLVTQPVIGRFGLGGALLFAPAALAGGSFAVLCSGTLAAGIVLKGGDQALRYSVDRAATELLYRPLQPRELFDSKSFIDAVVSRGGDAVGALIVLTMVGGLHLTFRSLGVVSILLIVGWLLATRAARRTYSGRLLQDLRHGPLPALSTDSQRAKHASPSSIPIRDVLGPDPARRLRALRMLAGTDLRKLRRRRAVTILTTAVGAEIVGFAVLVEAASSSPSAWTTCRKEGVDAIERIARLLLLLSPDSYPECLAPALCSGDVKAQARAQAYLDTTLPSPHRELLMQLLDRWARVSVSSRFDVPPGLFATACGSVKEVLALPANHFAKGAAS
jgi:AAA family ATP:ADP antiporter